MRRILVAAMALACSGDPDPQPTTSGTTTCCRRCTTGKPCGDSCIPQESTCNAGPGCACYLEREEDTESSSSGDYQR